MQEEKEEQVELKVSPVEDKEPSRPVETPENEPAVRASSTGLAGRMVHNLWRAGVFLSTIPISVLVVAFLIGLVCSPVFLSMTFLGFLGLRMEKLVWSAAHIMIVYAVAIPFFFSVSQTYLTHFFKGTDRFIIATRVLAYLIVLPLCVLSWAAYCVSDYAPVFAANAALIGSIIAVVFCFMSEFGIRLARRHLRILTESNRPIGKLWLTAMVVSVVLLVPPVAFPGFGIFGYGAACFSIPFFFGALCSFYCKERRPLEALKVAVSITSYVSWTILFFSGGYLLSALLQSVAAHQIVSALLCGPLGLLSFVALVGAGAAMAARLVSRAQPAGD